MSDLAKESGHWYDRNGKPCHTVLDGKGRERNTHLGDARKLGLVPSVTTITGMLNKPALNDWKTDRVIESTLITPRLPSESNRDYYNRVKESANSRKAADRGIALHAAIEKAVGGQMSLFYQKHVEKVAAEMTKLGLDLYSGRAEHSFAHPDGYGGKTDFWLGDWVCDFKSKDVIDSTKKLAYDEHCIQLAAYARGVGIEKPRAANIFVGVDDCEVVVHPWTAEELARGLAIFQNLFSAWKLIKNWDPPEWT